MKPNPDCPSAERCFIIARVSGNEHGLSLSRGGGGGLREPRKKKKKICTFNPLIDSLTFQTALASEWRSSLPASLTALRSRLRRDSKALLRAFPLVLDHSDVESIATNG